ncbi:MAG: DUF2892 domain-containing protein [Sulfurimonas sp.]|nr:DUF2892 domain-containing protein [Sulfurimonas sp.]
MDLNKVRSFCRVFRIILGLTLIAIGVFQAGTENGSLLWFLGIIPLIAGLVNFCPLCLITKKCDLPN